MSCCRRGFAVIEVCCAIGLASFVMLASWQMFMAASVQRRALSNRTLALVEAGSAAERVAAIRRAEDIEAQVRAIDLSPAAAVLPAPRLDIELTPPAPSAETVDPQRRVVIRVSWESIPGQRSEVSLVTWWLPETDRS